MLILKAVTMPSIIGTKAINNADKTIDVPRLKTVKKYGWIYTRTKYTHTIKTSGTFLANRLFMI